MTALKVEGIDTVIRNLKRLPKEFSTARKRTVLKQAFEPFINRAVQLAPKDTGDLALSIDSKTFRNNKRDVFAGVISKKKIRIKKGQFEQLDAFYAKFIEFGYTHIGWPKKGKRLNSGVYSEKSLTEIPPRPFLRPAWDETERKVEAKVGEIVDKRLKAYAKKLIKQAKAK